MSVCFYASKTSVVILPLATVVPECATAQQLPLFVGLAGARVAEPVKVAMFPEGAENCSAAEKIWQCLAAIHDRGADYLLPNFWAPRCLHAGPIRI